MTKVLLVGAEPDKMPRLKMTYKCLKSLGHDVKVFAPFQRKGNSIMRYLANMVKLMFERSDEYHFFNIPDVIGLPLLFKRGRLVYDMRSPWEEGVLDAKGNVYLAKIARIVERVFCLRADDVVAANELLGKRAQLFGAGDVTIVPNFLYEELSTEGWEQIRNMYIKPKEKEKALVLFFGKISIPEGSNILSDLIIETSKKVYDLFDVEFIILGDGPEYQNLINRVASEGIETLRTVHFLGWVPHSGVGKFIRAADLCIVPREESGVTKWMHPSSIWKINEALSIGTPILSTKYGGLQLDSSIPSFMVTENKDFYGAMINALEVALRWREDSRVPVKRDWRVCRDILAEVYGDVSSE